MTRSLLRSLLGGLLTLLTLSYSLSAQNDTPEQMVIYSHDQNQQVVKKTFDISQVDSIRFAVVEAPATTIPESPVPFGSNKDQIATYEATAGTTLDSDLSGSQGEEYMYVYRVNKSPMIMRIYFVSKDGAGELNEYWAVMDNYDEVFQEADGKISLTESFIASLTKSGYTAPIAGDEGTFLSSKGNQYDLSIMPGTGGDLGIEVDKIVVLDFAPRGEFLPKE